MTVTYVTEVIERDERNPPLQQVTTQIYQLNHLDKLAACFTEFANSVRNVPLIYQDAINWIAGR
jgi:hypothetical protein